MSAYHRRKHTRHRSPWILVVLLALVLVSGTSTLAQDDVPTIPLNDVSEPAPEPLVEDVPPTEAAPTEAPTEVPPEPPPGDATEAPTESLTEAPTEVPTEVPTQAPTEVPTEVPTESATEVPTDVPTEAAPTESPTEAPTDESIELDLMSSLGDSLIMPLAVQTWCQMEEPVLDVAPFAFQFAATGANIASYTWDFGDGTAGASGPSVSHTYGLPPSSPASYEVTLTCKPENSALADIVLKGTVTINSAIAPSARISLSYGTTPPSATIVVANQSTGDNLTLSWKLSTSSDPTNDAAVIATFGNVQNISHTFTAQNLPSGGQVYVHLTVTGPAGTATWTGPVQQIVLPPLVTFTAAPAMGTSPLEVVITSAVDPSGGEPTSWAWTFAGGNLPSATGPGPHTVTFTDEGPHEVSLVYSNSSGGGTVTKTVLVTAEGDDLTPNFTWNIQSVNGQVRVCFTNISEGPFTQTEWILGDGTTVLNENNPCHTYDASLINTAVNVQLIIRGEDDESSTKSEMIILSPELVASFNITPATGLETYNTITFTDTTTGTTPPTSWLWDFGDGTTSTVQHPTHVYEQPGIYTVRLTASNSTNTAYVEKIISVERRALTCDVDGDFSIVPNALANPYSYQFVDVAGRDLTYAWTISAGTFDGPTNGSSVSVNWPDAAGTYELRLTVTSPDGLSCNITKRVEIAYPPMSCDIVGTLPDNVYPNGDSYTFNASNTNLANRTVASQSWALYEADDLSSPLATSNTGSFAWTTPSDNQMTDRGYVLRYSVQLNDGTTCEEQRSLTVSGWPALSCTINTSNGGFSPQPSTASNTTYSYSVSISGLAGRQATSYQWTAGAGGDFQSSDTSSTTSLKWTPSVVVSPGSPFASTIGVSINVPNADAPVTCSRNVSVQVSSLTCAAPTGDLTPLVDETLTYSPGVGNAYNRPVSYVWELLDGSDVVATGTDGTFSHQFLQPGATYTLRYTASVPAVDGSLNADSCSNSATIQVKEANTYFTCAANLTGNPAPQGSAQYSLGVDNGNGLALNYTYTLVRGSETWTLDTGVFSTKTGNGTITSPSFSLAQLGPLGPGPYTLRVNVSAAEPADALSCERELDLQVGKLTVDYTYTPSKWPTGDRNFGLGEPICITAASNVFEPPMPQGENGDVVYTWTVNGTPVDNFDTLPGCFTPPSEGSYTITLTGNDASRNLSDSQSYTFNVYGLQSITANRTGGSFVGMLQTLTATGVNITSDYSWTITDPSNTVHTGTGATLNRTFNVPGKYQVVVKGTGPLGETSAAFEFTLRPTGGLAARFMPSPASGTAPLQVCFTDLGVSNGDPISSWAWDFGDGVGTSTEQNPCYTYSAPGRYVVRQDISNGSFNEFAERVVRVYSLWESSATFTYTVNEQGAFCFTAVTLPNGAEVTGWDFGDGNTSTEEAPCHQYAQAGTFYVVMKFSDDPQDPNKGEIEQPVVVPPGNIELPVLTVTAVCGLDGIATFNITRTGDALDQTVSVTLRNYLGQVVAATQGNSLSLNSSGPWTFTTASPQVGPVTISFDYPLINPESTLTANCGPVLNATVACEAYLPVFTITNETPDVLMSIAQGYEIVDANNVVVKTGTIQFTDPSVSTLQIRLDAGSDPYINYTFRTTGSTVTPINSVSSNCAPPAPALSVSASCEAQTFTITNSASSGAMVVEQDYVITDASNTTVATGKVPALQPGASTTVNLPSGLDPYAGYTLTVTNTNGSTVSENLNCGRPALSVSASCEAQTFTVANGANGGPMVVEQDYVITNASNTVVASGKIPKLDSDESTTINMPAGLDPYAGYTLTITNTNGTTTSGDLNCPRPALSVAPQCSAISFVITNGANGGPMVVDQDYIITDLEDNPVPGGTGTITTLLNPGETKPVLLPFNLDPYAGYKLTISNPDGTTTSGTMECPRPVLNPTTVCTSPVQFIVTNDGDSAGPMLVSQIYSVVDSDNNPVPFTATDDGGNELIPNTMHLAVGESITITLNGVNPYHVYTLQSDGYAGTVNLNRECEAPAIEAWTSCFAEGGGRFNLRNDGGDMQEPHSYTIHRSGTLIATGEFQLKAGERSAIGLPDGTNVTDRTLRLHSDTFDIEFAESLLCEKQPGAPESSISPEPTPWPTATPDIPMSPVFPVTSNTPTRPTWAGGGGGFVGLPTTPETSSPVWGNTCGYGCPIFRVYHTDETGDWEIFRVDSADKQTRTNVRRNLSYGRSNDPDVQFDDMAPSLSPNTEWVAFTSNRDGNWEIYVASTNGDPNSVQRVTFNQFSTDTDPVWGPNNFVAFETTRNGNWDLYVVDMTTGAEYRLTDDAGDDINAAWSPDGSRLLFQSNRPDEDGVRQWQIYELTLANMALRRLSDGTSIDVDPQYAHNGGQIVFRSYADENANSVLMLMDANGQNRRAITREDEDATNAAWSPFDRYIAYQSSADGDLDVYVYELATGLTRQLTDNTIDDYAPTWLCDETRVVFTSDIEGDPNIYEVEVTPMDAPGVLVDEDADQWTFEPSNDIYPLVTPADEYASREGRTIMGPYGEQTVFLMPDPTLTRIEPSRDGVIREDWNAINSCTP